MKFLASKKYVEKIDEPIWKEMSIRSELVGFIQKDEALLLDMLERVLDDEFELFYGEIMSFTAESEIELIPEVEKYIEFILSKRGLTESQALTLILDIVETFIINGKRMCG